MTKLTQEKLRALIGSFLGEPPDTDHDGDLYIQAGLKLNSAKIQLDCKSGGGEATNLDVVVKFALSDKEAGDHQLLEIICFAPRFPDKPYLLTLQEEQYPDAVEFCSQLTGQVVPHIRIFLSRGYFYVIKDIEDPAALPDEWLVNHWLKPYFGAAMSALMLIGKRFGGIA